MLALPNLLRLSLGSTCLAAVLLLTPGAVLNSVSAAGANRLVVHEWGTFTSLQDEQGRELSGINTDDEPVPAFVHNLNPFLLSRPVLSSLHWQYRQKGAPRVHPHPVGAGGRG